MKKLVFGLIATTLLSITSNAQCTLQTSGEDSKWEKVDPALIGKLHNQYLEEAIKIKTENPKLTDEEVLMKIDIQTVSKELQSCYFNTVSNTSVEDMNKVITNTLGSEAAKQYYPDLLDALDKSDDYKTISSSLDVVKAKIDKLPAGVDKDILLSCLETGRSSSYFWISKEKGGSGLGDEYLTTQNISARGRGSKDMAGAGYGMVCWSFSAFLGPVGAAGLIYGAVSGAIVSSFLP